ncbi:hypothetical protein ID866_11303 [Astraeus odoratus]|nr:hypothetical protein ID866_11303 [Astraeus odoratus]
MSSPCCTLSPHKVLLAKTMDACQCTEAEWHLISEGELNPVSSDDEHMAEMRGQEKKQRVEEEAEHLECKEAAKKVQEEAERKAEEEHKAQEEAARAKEEAERIAKMAAKREEAAKRAVEATEERADTERRALEEQLWEAVGQWLEVVVAPLWEDDHSRASGVQDPCTQCHNKGTLCVLGAAKGKTMACEACCHAKVSCSWLKKTVGETQKWK